MYVCAYHINAFCMYQPSYLLFFASTDDAYRSSKYGCMSSKNETDYIQVHMFVTGKAKCFRQKRKERQNVKSHHFSVLRAIVIIMRLDTRIDSVKDQ